MKYVLILSLFLVACTQHQGINPGATATSGGTAGAKTSGSSNATTQANGGVDVGNMVAVAFVPETNAYLTYPKTWNESEASAAVSLSYDGGSTISAEKAQLATSDFMSIKAFLKKTYPDREYAELSQNGMRGLRSDFVKTSDEQQSDIYLISELKDLVHVQATLKKDQIVEGEKIISTVRIEYKGLPIPNSSPKTVTLMSYGLQGDEHLKAAYSFAGNCFAYLQDAKCGDRGVTGLYYPYSFSIGNAGYDTGRIIELGDESNVPFESIQIDGKYLVAPSGKTPISDIYTTFDPKDQKAEQSRIRLEAGKVYLIRTISWPDEDMILKMRVDAKDDQSVTITYQNLVYVPKEQLQKQVDALNTYTKQSEQPHDEGEVTLYNRSNFDAYSYASFNFQYSTSGNQFITNNSWDVMLEGNSLESAQSGSELSSVIAFGNKDIGTITRSDFPNPNDPPQRGQKIVKGNTYGIFHFEYGGKIGTVYGALQVLDCAPDLKWVRFKYRRIYMGPAEHFQNWISLKVPDSVLSVTLEKSSNWMSQIFFPFIMKRGTEGSHYYESMTLGLDPSRTYLRVDSRPYGTDRGFYKLGKNIPFDGISENEILKYKGTFSEIADIETGDTYAVYLENYNDKTVMLLKVENIVPAVSAQFSIKYISRAKTSYSDDQD